MLHTKQAQYPIIDSEFDTRFFDKDLVDAVIDADRQYFENPAMKKYIVERNDIPMDWDSMTLLDQIQAQIGFVAPPPRWLDIEDEISKEDSWAERVLKEIEAINAQ